MYSLEIMFLICVVCMYVCHNVCMLLVILNVDAFNLLMMSRDKQCTYTINMNQLTYMYTEVPHTICACIIVHQRHSYIMSGLCSSFWCFF